MNPNPTFTTLDRWDQREMVFLLLRNAVLFLAVIALLVAVLVRVVRWFEGNDESKE